MLFSIFVLKFCREIPGSRLTGSGYYLRWNKMWKGNGMIMSCFSSETDFLYLGLIKPAFETCVVRLEQSVTILLTRVIHFPPFFVQVCRNNECVPLSVAYGGQRTCANNCSGNGVRFIFGKFPPPRHMTGL